MTYENIRFELRGDGPLQVALITLHRPQQLNALNDALIDELVVALAAVDAGTGIGCAVITGSDKAFAAGADVRAMADFAYPQVVLDNFISRNWDRIARTRKPLIAAVNGFALGGGCELALMCDLVIAGDTARFGQPEVKLAVIPGAGGTQRLPRAIGKAKAMDPVLTGRMMDAAEAERAGLVSRVVPPAQCLDAALAAGADICRLSLPSVLAAKECVNAAYETTLAEGSRFERRAFHASFATQDQKEGMRAFLEKRSPQFQHR